jgi:hypothetical protein
MPTNPFSTMIQEHFMPVTAIHPGEHLTEELNALDMCAADYFRLADHLGVIAW